jgi:hypothetical protein
MAISHAGKMYLVKLAPNATVKQVTRLCNPAGPDGESGPVRQVLWQSRDKQPRDATVRYLISEAAKRWKREGQ